MIPSREHFLLKRRNALSTFSFSPTLTVDIFFTILCRCVYFVLRNYTNFPFFCQVFFRPFSNLFPLFCVFSKVRLGVFVGFYTVLSRNGKGLIDRFEIFRGVLAPRTNEIGGKFLFLVRITANFAYPAFGFAFGCACRRSRCRGLGFDIALVIFVRYRFIIGQRFRFGNLRNEQGMRAVIVIIDDLRAHDSVCAIGYIIQAVFRPFVRFVREFIHVPARYETKLTEDIERRFFRQDGNVEYPRFTT